MTGAKPEPLVLSRREGAVLTLTLNRPEKSNSLHPDLVKQLSAALKAAEADNALSVMELAGVLASKPQGALFATKRLTRELIDLDTNTALDEINKTFRRCLASDEHRRRVAEVYESLRKRHKADDEEPQEL